MCLRMQLLRQKRIQKSNKAFPVPEGFWQAHGNKKAQIAEVSGNLCFFIK